MSEPDRRISKMLSYWLRHAPEAGGFALDEAGWAPLPDVLSALEREGVPLDLAGIARIAASSDKQRFEISPGSDRIRARQGHSVKVAADWVAATPPAYLYHGTVERFLPSILAEGLLPRSRHHVHLSPDVETARQVGARRGRPVILEIRAAALAETGAAFRLSSNGVWLADHVPASFLRLCDQPLG